LPNIASFRKTLKAAFWASSLSFSLRWLARFFLS